LLDEISRHRTVTSCGDTAGLVSVSASGNRDSDEEANHQLAYLEERIDAVQNPKPLQR
jgi:hypothetical protein